MSKPALQELSKEKRGKVTASWQVELDEEMMFMLLKLKRKFGKNLSNKECLRKVLRKMQDPQKQAKKSKKIPGKISRTVSAYQKSQLPTQCSHLGCHRPAEIIHHPKRFSEKPNHEDLRVLCKLHHEFAHNGISEPMRVADYRYREKRQEALL